MPRRFLLAAGCLLFLAFAAYGSFVPFHIERISFAQAVERFSAVRLADPRTASKTDLVANVLLFVPIGFTLAGVIADRSKRLAWVSLPLVAAFALAASIAIEFGQTFIVGRTPSWNDVLAETLGAIAGAVGWLIVGSRALDWLRPLAEPSSPVERMRRLLVLYAIAWLVLQVLPLDLTLRVPELAQKYRSGRIIVRPFAGTTGVLDAVVKLVSVAIPAIPIGALGVVMVGAGRQRAARGALFGAAVVCALEAIQVLVVSRTASVTDVIAGGVGVLAGAWLGARWTDASDAHGDALSPPPTVRPWALLALVAWIAVIVVRHWAPFDFTLTRELYDARIHRLVVLPFKSYYRSNYLDALGEAIAKTLLGLPVGVLLHAFWPPAGSRGARVAQVLIFVTIAFVLFSTIELGQVFLPSRFPDDTDILLGVVGVTMGIAAVGLVDRRRD